MKEIFKAIQDTFNNKYIKTLYLTLFVFIMFFSLVSLIILYPELLGVMVLGVMVFGIYIIIFDLID